MEEEITAEYILSQLSILSDLDLITLIENYGQQEYTKGTKVTEYK